jgi:hypothetical protein
VQVAQPRTLKAKKDSMHGNSDGARERKKSAHWIIFLLGGVTSDSPRALVDQPHTNAYLYAAQHSLFFLWREIYISLHTRLKMAPGLYV